MILGSFIADIRIDDNLFECQIHVLPDNYLAHDLLLGGELSDMAEIRIKRRQATIVKLKTTLRKLPQEAHPRRSVGRKY